MLTPAGAVARLTGCNDPVIAQARCSKCEPCQRKPTSPRDTNFKTASPRDAAFKQGACLAMMHHRVEHLSCSAQWTQQQALVVTLSLIGRRCAMAASPLADIQTCLVLYKITTYIPTADLLTSSCKLHPPAPRPRDSGSWSSYVTCRHNVLRLGLIDAGGSLTSKARMISCS